MNRAEFMKRLEELLADYIITAGIGKVVMKLRSL